MARIGETISNPLTGERITFLKTAADGTRDSLIFDCRVTPGGVALPPHRHQTQEERFEVFAGTLGVRLGGKKQILQAGDTIVLPAKITHQWWNAGDDEVYFRVEVVPARNLEAVLEAVCGMAQAGKMNGKCMPKNPFLLANLGRLSESYLPGIPIWMQKTMLRMGSVTGQVLGYDPSFASYRSAVALEPSTDQVA